LTADLAYPLAVLGSGEIGTLNRQVYNGLWLVQRALGEARTRRYLGRLQETNLRRIGADLSRAADHRVRPLPRKHDVSPDEFVRDYLLTNAPAVFPGVARTWGACQKWSPRFFADHCGDLTFWALPASSKQLEASGLSGAIETTVRDLMMKIEAGDDSYARFLPLLSAYPELLDDLDVPWFRARRGPRTLLNGQFQLFVGSGGSDTLMHAAMANNLFLQVQGRKRWRLFPPSFTPALQPVANRSPYFVSLADADKREHDDSHPHFRHAAGYDVELEPGDVLYIPPYYWHQVQNPTPSIGIGYRWLSVPSILSASPIQTLLTLTATDPPFWKQDLAAFVKSGAAGWVDADQRRKQSRSA
jgi:hypothetical protein